MVAEHFGRHREAEAHAGLPGLGAILAARILGEFGDDPHRYRDAKARKNYAGTSSWTVPSPTIASATQEPTKLMHGDDQSQ